MIEIREIKYDSELPIDVGQSTYKYIWQELNYQERQFIWQIVLKNFILKIYFLPREIIYKSELPIGVGKSTYIYDQTNNLFDRLFWGILFLRFISYQAKGD